jgi:phenylpropionate dioxygenase-like ring-hydroxylating dioxygenase large terminal subunit
MLQNGFPYESYPTGWFQIAWEASLAPGEVTDLHYFGQDLVMFRDEEGTVRVFDAHCPHQGAHLGIGGTVKGCEIVCPFHGWTWGPDGSNTSIPDESRPNRSRKLRAWTTEVTNGMVWVWYDELGRPPTWSPPEERPELSDGRHYPIYPHSVRRYENVRVLPQWIAENNADIAHLRTVHRAAGPIDQTFTTDGPVLRSRTTLTFGYGKPTSGLTPEGPREGALVSELWGMGIIQIVFADVDNAWLIQSVIPVDQTHSDIFVTVISPREEGDDGDEPTGRAKARFAEQCKQLERDFPIWENMRYVVNGPMTRQEGLHLAPLRRWARQFYPDAGLTADGDDRAVAIDRPRAV